MQSWLLVNIVPVDRYQGQAKTYLLVTQQYLSSNVHRYTYIYIIVVNKYNLNFDREIVDIKPCLFFSTYG